MRSRHCGTLKARRRCLRRAVTIRRLYGVSQILLVLFLPAMSTCLSPTCGLIVACVSHADVPGRVSVQPHEIVVMNTAAFSHCTDLNKETTLFLVTLG